MFAIEVFLSVQQNGESENYIHFQVHLTVIFTLCGALEKKFWYEEIILL